MKYKVEGDSLPVLICELNAGESIISEVGGRTWMKGDIETKTITNGGIGKAIGRMFTGEGMFVSQYIANSNCELGFASSFPGKIVAVELQAGESIVAQKGAFLAYTPEVTFNVFFQRKIGAGFFGGEGFVMQKFTGPGVVFLEIDGYAKTYDLANGETITCDTGVVAVMDATCKLEIKMVKGVKNMVFGKEGLFDTIVTGPGKVTVQSMPISAFASLFIKK